MLICLAPALWCLLTTHEVRIDPHARTLRAGSYLLAIDDDLVYSPELREIRITRPERVFVQGFE